MKFASLFFFLILSNIIYSQEYGEYPVIEKDLLLRDLEILYQGLDKFHTGMYWYTPEDSVEIAYEEAKKKIVADLNVLEFYKIAAPLVALSKEGHTNIYLPNPARERMRQQARFFPARVIFLDKELYFTRNGSNTEGINDGDKILSINGQSIDEVVKNIGSLFSSDGYIQSVKLSDLRGFGFSRFYYYFYGNVDRFNLVLDDGRHVELTPLSIEEINNNLAIRYQRERQPSPPKEYLEFKLIHDSIAYLGIHSFSNSDYKKSINNRRLTPFLEESFYTIVEENIQYLIIDLSENDGGNEGNENLVYSYLGENYQKYIRVNAKTQKAILDNGIDRPIKLTTFNLIERVFANRKMDDGSYERKENVGFGLNAYKKEPKYKYDGHLYVLIGPLTYSAGSELSNMLYSNDLGLFIGEETGGGYYGNTSGYSEDLILPHTQIRVNIPALQFEMNVDERIPFGRGVLPHYEVIPTFEEYINGVNSALDYTLNLIENND